MKRVLRGALGALSLSALAACVAITPVEPGPLALGASHQVTLGREWSDISAIMPQRSKNVRVLSVDGPLLDCLYLGQGLSSGEGLLKAVAKEKTVPTFKADMSPTELVELVADSVSAMGYQRVSTNGLRPARIAGASAYRFDLAAQTDSGLQLTGTAQVALLEGKLYIVLFLAPSEHYYAEMLPEIEAIMRSQA